MLSRFVLKCVVGFALALSPVASAVAAEIGVWADGVVTYRHPDGNLVNRDCRLWVPAMGLGQVKLQCGDFVIATADFDTESEAGRKIFSVTFVDVPGAPEGAQALYRGTYLRGDNRAVYYGDVFSRMEGQGSEDWQYAGGFMFAADVR